MFDSFVAASIITMVYYAFGVDPKRSGYYFFTVGIGYLARAILMALTPLGQPVGNNETMGIGLLLNIYQHGMFPSGHTYLTAVIFFLIDRERAPRLKIATGIFCALEMICLLLSHAHYSIDLVGGLMVAFLTKYLMDRYKDRFLESPTGGKAPSRKGAGEAHGEVVARRHERRTRMNDLILPAGYEPKLGVREVEVAIKEIKDFFEKNLAKALNLTRVTAPTFVQTGTGINDDLNGVERPIRFRVREDGDGEVEIVQSLAKWKRLALARYGFREGEGLYTDMNAIRPDDRLDNIHSIYVDQWDWERVIAPEERTRETLERTVRAIYDVVRRTELYVASHYATIRPCLPREIAFVTSEELCARFPDVSPREREDRIVREHGAVFVIGIGAELADGQPHDGRAPDYDDWITPRPDGGRGPQRRHPPLEPGARAVVRDLLDGHPRERGVPPRAAEDPRRRGARDAPLPPRAPGRRAAPVDRRRHRPVAPLHVLPADRPHRRGGRRRLAARDGGGLRAGEHLPALSGRPAGPVGSVPHPAEPWTEELCPRRTKSCWRLVFDLAMARPWVRIVCMRSKKIYNNIL